MRAPGWCLLGTLIASCNTAQSAESSQPPVRKPKATQAALGAWFALSGASCRADTLALRLVTRPARRSDVRVTRDVRALSVQFACQEASGTPLDPEAMFARGVAVSLLGPDGRTHPARMPGAGLGPDAAGGPFSLEFELDRDEPAARAGYTFDPATGEPKAGERAGLYTLVLGTSRERVELALRQPFETPAFERALAAIARALVKGTGLAQLAASELTGELEDVQRAYGEVAERYAPRLLRMEPAAAGGEVLLTVRLDELSRSAALAQPLTLTLTLAADGERYPIRRCESPAALRSAVRCAALERALDDGIARELETRKGPGGGECSVLGYPLPGECDGLSARLRDQAFALGEACSAGLDIALAPRKLPDDLQVVLRRGKRARELARSPRYTLVVFHNGHVVFHPPNTGGEGVRKNGRTPARLVEKLYADIERLAWFTRRGGDFDAARCGRDADSGDVITIVANGRERMIPNRDGCRGPFTADELELLAQHIAAVGGARGFYARPREARDPQVRIWTVSAD